MESTWKELSDKISLIEAKVFPVTSDTTKNEEEFQPLPASAASLLPLIEAYFALSETLESYGALRLPQNGQQVESPSQTESSAKRTSSFAKFVERHRRLLNTMLRNNPSLLESSMVILLLTPRYIDFDNKRTYFRSMIESSKRRPNAPQIGTVRLNIRRSHILEDSFQQLRLRSPYELSGRLSVTFKVYAMGNPYALFRVDLNGLTLVVFLFIYVYIHIRTRKE